MSKLICLCLILFLFGCSTTYRPPIIRPRDPLLLIDCVTPAQPEKFAELIMEKLR